MGGALLELLIPQRASSSRSSSFWIFTCVLFSASARASVAIRSRGSRTGDGGEWKPPHSLGGERPLAALVARGVEYVEVRAFDVNPYPPLGIDAEQERFIDAFLLHCLLSDSPRCGRR